MVIQLWVSEQDLLQVSLKILLRWEMKPSPRVTTRFVLGNTSVTSIGGQVSWSTLSDGRFKKEIKDDVSGLDFITQLHPVSYTVDVKSLNTFLGIDNEEQPQLRKPMERHTGFIAQEVEAVIKKTGYVFHG